MHIITLNTYHATFISDNLWYYCRNWKYFLDGLRKDRQTWKSKQLFNLLPLYLIIIAKKISSKYSRFQENSWNNWSSLTNLMKTLICNTSFYAKMYLHFKLLSKKSILIAILAEFLRKKIYFSLPNCSVKWHGRISFKEQKMLNNLLR